MKVNPVTGTQYITIFIRIEMFKKDIFFLKI